MNNDIVDTALAQLLVRWKGGIDAHDSVAGSFEVWIRAPQGQVCSVPQVCILRQSASYYAPRPSGVSYYGTSRTDSITRYAAPVYNSPPLFSDYIKQICGPSSSADIFIRSIDTNGNFRDSDPVIMKFY